MATLARTAVGEAKRRDFLSGTPRAGFVDRWIYVFTAASFIVIVLAGFVPSSLDKIAAVQAGQRPPFPPIMHMHAVLMGSFLLLVLAQTWLMATGRRELHMRLGILAMVLAPALVIVGFLLAPAIYHGLRELAQTAPPGLREKFQKAVLNSENIKLIQLRVEILFPLFLIIGLRARGKEAGLHKRMMILATAVTLPAGIDRIPWLPSTLPASPVSPDLYTLLAVSPMFVWDVVRNRYVHKAYLIWFAVGLPFAVVVHGLWDTEWWHATARQMMGV